MGENYKHLTWRERLIIETRLKDGWSKQRIADELGRHVSTICREIKRGLGIQRTTELIDRERYIPDIAQARYEDHYPDKGPGLKIGKVGTDRRRPLSARSRQRASYSTPRFPSVLSTAISTSAFSSR